MKSMNIKSRYRIRPLIGVIGFISWSVAMIAMGTVIGNQFLENSGKVFGISPSYAGAMAAPEWQIIRLDRDRLAGNNLGEFAPYEPENGDLIARGHEYFYSEDGNMGIGVWESKPGKISYVDLGYDELMYVLEGSMVMTDEHGKSQTYSAGEGMVLPKGWSGTLAVPEGGVRKIWVAYMDEDGKG